MVRLLGLPVVLWMLAAGTATAAMPPEIPLRIPCHFIIMSKQLQKPEQSAP